MKCPGPGYPDDEKRLHALRTADLEHSGVSVCEIDDYDQNTELLTQLLRRTRPARIFISGRTRGLKGKRRQKRTNGSWVTGRWQSRANWLLERTWRLHPSAAPQGGCISRDVARLRRLDGSYDPGRADFHFRHKMSLRHRSKSGSEHADLHRP